MMRRTGGLSRPEYEMQDRDTQYAIVVKAPTVPLRPLQGADWVILEMTDRRDICARRFAGVQRYLAPHPKAQVIVYSFPKDDIGKVRCIGNFNARKVPPLRDIRLTDKTVREAFWYKVERATGERKVPAAAAREGLSRKAKLWIAALVTAAACVPVAIVGLQVSGQAAPRAGVSTVAVNP